MKTPSWSCKMNDLLGLQGRSGPSKNRGGHRNFQKLDNVDWPKDLILQPSLLSPSEQEA